MKMLNVCEYDFEHGAKFLGSRNKLNIFMFLDSGLRVSELTGVKVEDINVERGWIKMLGKGSKERMVRIGTGTQKALWRYMAYRGECRYNELFLSEERRPMKTSGIQSVITRLKQWGGIITR
jgi:site-specific recombinase XerC